MLIVGFDLGKRKSQLCVEDADGKILAELRIDTKREDIVSALSAFPGARILIEASTSSEWVARALEAAGFEVVVADPRFSLMYAQTNKKVKTDRRDARALADALRLKAFRPAHRRSNAARHLHGKLVVRRRLVGMRTKMINVVRALCEQEGIDLPRCTPEVFDDAVNGTQMDAVLFETITPALSMIGSLNKQVADFEAELDALAAAHPTAKLLRTVRGVGTLTSLAFIAVIDDPKRFESAREVSSYLGLVPGEHNSGDSKRPPGAITKSGHPLLRSYLYEAALTATKKQAPESHLKSWHAKLIKRGNARGSKRKALVAVARRLARILFAMWRDGTPFDNSRTAPAQVPASARKGAQAA